MAHQLARAAALVLSLLFVGLATSMPAASAPIVACPTVSAVADLSDHDDATAVRVSPPANCQARLAGPGHLLQLAPLPVMVELPHPTARRTRSHRTGTELLDDRHAFSAGPRAPPHLLVT
ncbi:MAG TPA: hypothetical protein VFJ14_04150 [Nocardioidaceae bacterium]|nr:hypothetical protein [Nocardioidaceae bacterium]